MAVPFLTINSACGRFKAEIVRRSERVFQVQLVRWTEAWVEGYGKVDEFWESAAGLATFTDTIENAERLANELLKGTSKGIMG